MLSVADHSAAKRSPEVCLEVTGRSDQSQGQWVASQHQRCNNLRGVPPVVLNKWSSTSGPQQVVLDLGWLNLQPLRCLELGSSGSSVWGKLPFVETTFEGVCKISIPGNRETGCHKTIIGKTLFRAQLGCSASTAPVQLADSRGTKTGIDCSQETWDAIYLALSELGRQAAWLSSLTLLGQ